MPLNNDLQGLPISPLVLEEGNVVGQPGGGPLAGKIPEINEKRFIAAAVDTADAAGVADVVFSGPSVGYAWLIERITVLGAGTCDLYDNEVLDVNLVDTTASATKDIADEFSPIYIPGGHVFIGHFTGAGAGTVCKVRIQVILKAEG